MHHSSQEIQQPSLFVGWLDFQRQILGRVFRDETVAGFAFISLGFGLTLAIATAVVPLLVIPSFVGFCLLGSSLSTCCVELVECTANRRKAAADRLGFEGVFNWILDAVVVILVMLFTILVPAVLLLQFASPFAMPLAAPVLAISFAIAFLLVSDSSFFTQAPSMELLRTLLANWRRCLGHAVMIPAIVGASALLIWGLYLIHPAAGLIAWWPCMVVMAMFWAVQVGTLLAEQELVRPAEVAQVTDATNKPTTSPVINNRP